MHNLIKANNTLLKSTYHSEAKVTQELLKNLYTFCLFVLQVLSINIFQSTQPHTICKLLNFLHPFTMMTFQYGIYVFPLKEPETYDIRVYTSLFRKCFLRYSTSTLQRERALYIKDKFADGYGVSSTIIATFYCSSSEKLPCFSCLSYPPGGFPADSIIQQTPLKSTNPIFLQSSLYAMSFSFHPERKLSFVCRCMWYK